MASWGYTVAPNIDPSASHASVMLWKLYAASNALICSIRTGYSIGLNGGNDVRELVGNDA